MTRGIRVTAVDLETGDTSSVELAPGNYVVVCAHPCYLAGEQHHANGTTVLTVKGRAAQFMGPTRIVEPEAGGVR